MLYLNSKHLKSFLIYLFTLAAYFLALQCDTKNLKADPHTLAIIDKKSIGREYFVHRFKEFRRKTGAADNGLARRSLLQNMVDEEILICQARKWHFDTDEVGIKELERIKIQELLNAYHQRFIKAKIKVSDDELKQLFVNLNTKIKARHIYSPNKHQADSLYDILTHGGSFEDVARTCFNDPVLKESGGSLGYFTVDEMDPAFEQAAFSLKIGEISQPVRTVDGYSIIRVDDRFGNPLVTEAEFAKHRPKLAAYWEQRKTNKLTQQYVDSMRKELKITFNDVAVEKLFNQLKTRTNNTFTLEKDIFALSFQNFENEELLTSRLGKWSVENFREFAQHTSLKQQNWIRNKENLEDFIAGLVVRAEMLEQAKKTNLHSTEEYKKNVESDFANYLLERIEKTLYDNFTIPDDSLRAYFEEDRALFAEPAKVRLQEIVLSSEENIELISSQLKKGISFSYLAQQYSVNRESAAKGGDLGFLEAKDLGQWAKEILAMKIGEWSGPKEMNAYKVFLKCTDQIPSQLRTFQQAKLEVEEAVRAIWWQRIRESKIKEFRSTMTVASFPDKLTLVKIN